MVGAQPAVRLTRKRGGLPSDAEHEVRVARGRGYAAAGLHRGGRAALRPSFGRYPAHSLASLAGTASLRARGRPAGRGEALGAQSRHRFRGSPPRRIGGHAGTRASVRAIYRRRPPASARSARMRFRHAAATFADDGANAALRVGVLPRAVLVRKSAPDRPVIVDRDRVADAEVALPADVAEVFRGRFGQWTPMTTGHLWRSARRAL